MPGIISAAGAVGKAVNNAMIDYTQKRFQDKIDELQKCIAKLDGNLTNLKNYRSEIPNFWTGETADKYMTLLNDEIKAVQKAQENAKAQVQLHQETIEDLEKTQSDINAKIDEAKNVFSALNGLL